MSNIHVSCRVRPQNALEKKQGGVMCVASPDGKALEINPEDGFSTDYLRCTFDQVFMPQATQLDVYEATAKSLVDELLDGYNCTVFAYGQTGSGKTHTVLGPKEGVASKPDEQGLIGRLVHDIFARVQLLGSDTVQFELTGSFLEIYMEQIRDLLQPNFMKKNLRIRENGPKGVFVDDLTQVQTLSEDVMMQLVERGNTNRVVACTRMNNDSSRSHTILMINMTRRDVLKGTEKKATMYVVDLAGSEMVSKTMASGKTLNEARAINKSLSALSNVIKGLLTRLLQDSLGGHAKTCLIVTVSSSSYNVAETISTVRFGMRAKEIKNEPLLNETQSLGLAEYQQMYQELRAENAELRAEVEQVRSEKDALQAKCTSLEAPELEPTQEPDNHEHSVSADSQTYLIPLVDAASQTVLEASPKASSGSLMQAFSSFLFVDNQSQRTHHRTQSMDTVQSQLALSAEKLSQLGEDLRLCRSENDALKEINAILSEQNRVFNARTAELEAAAGLHDGALEALKAINGSINSQNTALISRNAELEAQLERQVQSLASQVLHLLFTWIMIPPPPDGSALDDPPTTDDSGLQKHVETLSRKLVEMKLHAHYVTEYAKAVLDQEKYEVVCQMTQLKLQNEQFRYNEHQKECLVKELEAKCAGLRETIKKSEDHASSVERSVQEYQSLYKEQVRLSHEKQQHLIKEVEYYKMIWHRVSKSAPEEPNNADGPPPSPSLALALEMEPTTPHGLHRPASFSGAVPSEPLSLMALKRSSRPIVKPLSPSPRTLLSPRPPRSAFEIKDDENDPLSTVFKVT
ncbi:kinesin-like protein [Achlya hypogyna]|uniref:Kinesin-like protein n=1 Tax=Achlya hypogyna TaxID=1202772 RepID=A0A1V9ZTN8_ACHHY|nr:kinesin-like protein [Achlya hypogyna]